jgi:amino acid permease
MLKNASLFISIVSLIFCVVSAVLVLFGKTSMDHYKQSFLIGSLFYIVFATIWSTREKASHDKSAISDES